MAIVPDHVPIEVQVGDLRAQLLAQNCDLRGIGQTVLHKALTMTGHLGVCVDAFLMDPRPRWLAHLVLRTPPV